MSLSFTAEARDSLSNLAASLNAGKDKSRGDGFFLFDLDRSQVEAMYRGDWLARKIVDIVPYDMVREWRVWSGDRAAVAAAEAAERRFGLRKLVQRALTLGRLYGGAAIVVGTGEEDPAALAYELVPDWIRPGGIKFLHVVSRWQLGAQTLCRDPLSPWFGEPEAYEITAPGRGALRLHPSRVIRFLGNELPDPSVGLPAWSDSVLQTLYDAIHAVALTTTGATSLMHEAKVDIVTVPNLSEHLSSAATTAQLSARFAYAAAMKSINNLLLLGDGETWSRQTVDFGGLPEMVRTFLQVAAGAADIPVTRLLGQSPAGMSATGESDTRNYYDMVLARQELDLRPQLERLDALLLRSAGVHPAALTFEFRPLWQMDAAAAASMALQKAQATQIYAGLNLWPAAVTAKLVEAQLAEDGTYPGAEGIFAEAPQPQPTTDFDPAQPRDPDGRWTNGGGGSSADEAELARLQVYKSLAANFADLPQGSTSLPLEQVIFHWERERKLNKKRERHKRRELEREQDIEREHGSSRGQQHPSETHELKKPSTAAPQVTPETSLSSITPEAGGSPTSGSSSTPSATPAGSAMSSEASATPRPFEQPSAGNLKRATRSMLERAAREAGYPSVEKWKTEDLQLNSMSDILVDRDGNAYSIPRQGSGEPHHLRIKVPK